MEDTEKRFYIEDYFLIDKEGEFTQGFNDRIDFDELCKFLNKQNDEIRELRKERELLIKSLSDSSKTVVDMLMPIDEDTLTLKGGWDYGGV